MRNPYVNPLMPAVLRDVYTLGYISEFWQNLNEHDLVLRKIMLEHSFHRGRQEDIVSMWFQVINHKKMTDQWYEFMFGNSGIPISLPTDMCQLDITSVLDFYG